mmetsp:Transcript_36701/g.57349  ORF Transcript_36701/g.57349 Transcript_36701/m.57349 type:complete len:317 (-) Transcript_36701:572-1522(-)
MFSSLCLEFVDTNNHVYARVKTRLLLGSTLLNTKLWHSGLNSCCHATQGFHLLHDCQSCIVDLVGKGFHHVTSRPRVDHLGDPSLVLKDQLCVASNASGEVCWQRNRLIKGIRVQGLGASHHSSHRLNRCSDHIIVRVLRLERVARGLAVSAEQQGLVVLWVKVLLHEVGPEPPGCTQLCNLHVKIHANSKEERETRSKLVNCGAHRCSTPYVLQTVCDRESELEMSWGPSFLHVISGNADGVELGQVLGAISHDVADDPQRRGWRVNVSVPRQVLLEDIILDRACQLLRGHPRLLRRSDVEGHDRKHSSVHRHAH